MSEKSKDDNKTFVCYYNKNKSKIKTLEEKSRKEAQSIIMRGTGFQTLNKFFWVHWDSHTQKMNGRGRVYLYYTEISQLYIERYG